MLNFIKKPFKYLTVILLLVYLGLIAVGVAYSDYLIFSPPATSYTNSNDLIAIKSPNNPTALNHSSKSTEHTIFVQYIENPSTRYTILYSHGNAVDIGQLHHLQQLFYNHGYSIIIYDYSGYGLSQGTASERQAYDDVQAVYRYLIDTKHLQPSNIIAYGHSLGAAVATDLAFKHPVAGLVLESPFTTAFRVKTIYPLVPFDKFSSIEKINFIDTPLFITHSRDDPVIPFWHGEELFNKAVQPKKSLWFNNEKHSNITHTKTFWLALNQFTSDL